MVNVLIWNENIHEREQPEVKAVYPNGIHGCIGSFLSENPDISVSYATLDMDNQGISEEVLSKTDVLIWWGHKAHDKITDENVRSVCRHINSGMGLIALHSAHYSKIFRALMGTSASLKWRHGDRERIWTVSPSHPIASGVPEHFELEKEEMYGEPFDIPEPDSVVFMGWFSGGEVFRSGVTFQRGAGKIFYFQPGHEEYPIYYNENIRKIILNAVFWAAPEKRIFSECYMADPLEKRFITL